MDSQALITILLSLTATFFALLVSVFSWMGNKLYSKLSEMASTMHNIESDLHGRISDLDRRVTKVETKIEDKFSQK
jgi:predicted PurR-regulated permease PerM